jgi:gamma-glutamyltranspeptidase / glutathione hydrolase
MAVCATLSYNGRDLARATSAADAARIHGGIARIMNVSPKAMVAACNPESAQAGLEILRQGGNAMDAFIAATWVDYVVAPGVSSAGGPLGLLVYDAGSRQIEYLHAGLKRVADPNGQYSSATPSRGRAVLVPGAVAGLAAAHQRYGHLPWLALLAPAVRIARDGFYLRVNYGLLLTFRSAVLARDDYARQTFFKDGAPLKAGDLLRQPLLAQTLENIAREGGGYFYQGKFARELIDAVDGRGGKLTALDLSSYHAVWLEPLEIPYRGYQVFVPSRYSNGGVKLGLALRLLENLDFKHQPHWVLSADTLVTMVRIYRTVETTGWIRDRTQLADSEVVRSHLSRAQTAAMWRDLPRLSEAAMPKKELPGSHSYHIVVVDERGNIVTGTNTIESAVWTDDPIFVGGIPLNDTGAIAVPGPPGEFTVEPLNPYIIENQGLPVFAGGTFASSMFPADMQVISNLIDFRMNPGDGPHAAFRHVFG